ncbi:hypothetical protein NW762_013436 [Fusarium torreyae]|uniref:Xaa-Pro dipeptidyl-peptidase C-terminal domain-containing protein n=1 Tax=Fusarium torreyae TaxID=1237075 RepID=A0A9W8RM69_9HYPO|nr:hypothetical protein NW762_013436 [Fusarium torreyae]
MADVALTKAELAKARSLGKFIQAWDPKMQGSKDPVFRETVDGDLAITFDVPIPVRDGTILRGNIYRPRDRLNEKLPVIFNYTVYGKDGGVDIALFPPGAGVDPGRMTKNYLFEAADPLWWCNQGYIVASIDARGSYMSDGDKSYYSRVVGLDGYDLVEWLAAQEWSNGKVALYGASGYAIVMWLVAAEQPPSLAAIIPIDGMTDTYREMAFKGGIPETQFREVWEWSITEESLLRQKAFLDTYLLGKQTEVQFWPKVRYAMREKYYTGEWRYSSDFPIPETDYQKLFLTPSQSVSYVQQPSHHKLSFDAKTEELEFKWPIREGLEFAGHAKMKIWVEVQGGDNLDLFITLRKRDKDGKDVYFPWLTTVDTGPIGFGWLRTSRRELDEAKSTPWQPYHSHQRDLEPLKPNEVVPVEIEIQPTSCRFRPGDYLVVVVSGHDYGEYPKGAPISRHTDTVNRGTAFLHFGDKYDSYLQLPVIPPVQHSYLHARKPVKMSMVASRVTGWSDKKFLDEYTNKHAEMTRKIAAEVPILRHYTQLVACPHVEIPGVSNQGERKTVWDCLTTLEWTSLDALGGSFHHPLYRASAGSHVFLEEADSIGIANESFVDVMFDPLSFEKRTNGALLNVMIAGSPSAESTVLEQALLQRASDMRSACAGTSVLRYVLNRRVLGGKEAKEFFHDTPFANGDWSTITAFEQYWFPSEDAAMDFFASENRRRALTVFPGGFDLSRSVFVLGRENIVVNKDTST